jgi:hypothetical protein
MKYFFPLLVFFTNRLCSLGFAGEEHLQGRSQGRKGVV